ncbi:MAG: hypothetical protein HUJ68_11440 [Clostridia bacterium]|mgnify:CR=1 FL=1|nr:hypothetical protein [Clostridia bacterium]
MNDKTNVSARGGVGLSGLLGVAFVVLKLCNVIDWSWKWVLAPFWIPLAICVPVLAIAFFVVWINTRNM